MKDDMWIVAAVAVIILIAFVNIHNPVKPNQTFSISYYDAYGNKILPSSPSNFNANEKRWIDVQRFFDSIWNLVPHFAIVNSATTLGFIPGTSAAPGIINSLELDVSSSNVITGAVMCPASTYRVGACSSTGPCDHDAYFSFDVSAYSSNGKSLTSASFQTTTASTTSQCVNIWTVKNPSNFLSLGMSQKYGEYSTLYMNANGGFCPTSSGVLVSKPVNINSPIIVVALNGDAFSSTVAQLYCTTNAPTLTINYQYCAPDTCTSLGKQCGSWPDSCGGVLSCGVPSAGFTCDANGQLVATPSFVNFQINVSNNGNIPYSNISLRTNLLWSWTNASQETATYPSMGPYLTSDIFSATPFTLAPGQSQTSTSSNLSIISDWTGKTVQFTAQVYGINSYTNQTQVFANSINGAF